MFVYICFVLFMLYVVTDFGITKCFKFVLKGVKPKILFFMRHPSILFTQVQCAFSYTKGMKSVVLYQARLSQTSKRLIFLFNFLSYKNLKL